MFIFVLFCYCYGHNGQALIVSVHIIHQPSAISLHSFRITIKKVLDNYAVKIGRAIRKAPAVYVCRRLAFM